MKPMQRIWGNPRTMDYTICSLYWMYYNPYETDNLFVLSASELNVLLMNKFFAPCPAFHPIQALQLCTRCSGSFTVTCNPDKITCESTRDKRAKGSNPHLSVDPSSPLRSQKREAKAQRTRRQRITYKKRAPTGVIDIAMALA